MPSYKLDFIRNDPHGIVLCAVYKTDGSARAAAMRMFKSGSCNPNDELYIYNKDGGCLGKVAYDHDGETIKWFPNTQHE